MHDTSTTLAELKAIVAQFMQERDWNKFHTPKNLSMNLAIEAAELMEKFVWTEGSPSIEADRQDIEDELADVLINVLCFAHVTGIDLSKAFAHKLAEIARKYPIEKSKGRADKYTKL